MMSEEKQVVEQLLDRLEEKQKCQSCGGRFNCYYFMNSIFTDFGKYCDMWITETAFQEWEELRNMELELKDET